MAMLDLGRHFCFVLSSRFQELGQLNEKLRHQLSAQEGAISSLTRAQQPTVSAIYFLFHNFAL